MYRFAFLVAVLIAYSSEKPVESYGSTMQIQGTCATKYTKSDPNHSQCITTTGSNLVTEHPPDADDIVEILARHNKYRTEANATNMMKMKWNADIAQSAQKLAATCDYGHDTGAQRREPGKFSVGQNIAQGADWESVIDGWAAEINVFPSDRVYVSGGGFGHYSQVVWAESSLVGCGLAECTTSKIFVCNYAPAGNFLNQVTYKNDGAICSECGSDRCSNNLCDCGSDNELNTCMNMGTLNLQTCGCTCRTAAYDDTNQCELNNCPEADTEYLCEAYNNPAYCPLFSNFPIDCPVMCETCPYSETGYTSK